MLHILAFIQCDICNGVLNEIAVAGDPRHLSFKLTDRRLEARLHHLRLTAEERGWQATEDSTKHYCEECAFGHSAVSLE